MHTTSTPYPTLYSPYIVCGLAARAPMHPTMPEWSRAAPFEKLAEAYTVIQEMGGLVFTLRLRKDAHDSVCGSADPARVMSRRIHRAFERAGLSRPHLAFSLEVTPDERNELHLHGAIAPGELDRGDIKRVLREAAGMIPTRAGSRQVQLKKFNMDAGGPRGWALYPRKGANRTRRVIEHNRITHIPADLNRRSRMSWEQRRRQESFYLA